jgi:hypothetical protein
MNKTQLQHAMSDTVAVAAFVLVGKLSHHEPLHLTEWFAAAWPFLLAWAIVNGIVLSLGVRRAERWSAVVGQVSALWLLSVPLALVVRELAYDKPVLLAFALTSTLFGAIFLLAGRLLVGFVHTLARAK